MRVGRKRALYLLAVATLLVGTTLAFAPSSAVAQSESSPLTPDSFERGSWTTPGEGNNEALFWPWQDCDYESRSDDPHWSTSQAYTVSAHGYWLKYGGTCTTATITERLYGWWCPGFSGAPCYWRWIHTARKRSVLPGGGRGRRATAFVRCVSTSRTVGFLGIVDVDIDNQADGWGRTESNPRNYRCVPPGEGWSRYE